MFLPELERCNDSSHIYLTTLEFLFARILPEGMGHPPMRRPQGATLHLLLFGQVGDSLEGGFVVGEQVEGDQAGDNLGPNGFLVENLFE